MWESSIWTLIADRHPRTPPRVFSVDVYIKAQQASAFSLLSLCISAKIMHMCNFFPPLPIQIKAPSGFHRSEVKVQFPTRVLVRRRSIHLGGGRRPLLQLIAVGNLWGWPVSRAPETNDVRPLIGCLQRRRRQLARADRWDAEQDPQGDGRAGEPWRGGGGSGDEDMAGQEEAFQSREVEVMEKVSWWARRQFLAGDRCVVYLTTTSGGIGHRGGSRGPR